MAGHFHTAHLLSWYLAGELSPSDLRRVADHLRICAACRRELDFMRQTIAALQALPLEETSVDFIEQLNRRIDREAELHRPNERQKLSSSPTGELHSVPEEVSSLSSRPGKLTYTLP